MNNETYASLFITGGTLSHNAPSYITRTIETHIFNALQREECVTVIGSRQVGKTSLLLKIQNIFQRYYPVAYVDFSTLNDNTADEETWAADFCELLNEQLLEYTKTGIAPSPPVRVTQFTQYWRKLAKEISTSQVLILFDEVSASLPPNIGDRFYSSIRAFLNENPRGYSQALSENTGFRTRFNFVFVGVFDPDQLIKNTKNSPFNIDTRYYLPDFSLIELSKLITNLDSIRPAENLDSLVATFNTYTSGHPFLSQCLARLVEDYLHAEPDHPLNSDLVTTIAPRLENIAASNLGPMVQRATEELLLNTLNQILNGHPVAFTRHIRPISQLELSGAIIEGENGLCCIRNKTYEQALRRTIPALIIAKLDLTHPVFTPTKEDIEHQFKLLEVTRRRLGTSLLQQAGHGSNYTPPSILTDIREARIEIERIKQVLREWGVPVSDHPDDKDLSPIT